MATAHAPTPAPATPARTTNPEWMRTTFASLMLAVLLKAGLHIPFLTTFITLGVIYAMNILFTEMRVGVMTAWQWTKNAGSMAMGVVIFLALRFLAAKIIGLYPIDSYGEIDYAEGFYGILPAHDVSNVILWEVMFAFVGGGMSVAWANGKNRGTIGMIFGVSLIILTFQIALPKYVATWPNRDDVSNNLASNGVVGASARGVWTFLFGGTTSTQEGALVLRYECATPCKADIRWPAQIWGDGPDFWVQFPGVRKPVLYSRGKFEAPAGVEMGETSFRAADPKKPVIVRVYERK